MFVAAKVPESVNAQESTPEPVSALLIAGNLALARQVAVSSWGWIALGLDRFRNSTGDEVRAVADRALGASIDWHPGTEVYLGPGWHERQDLKVLTILLHSGVLVEADPPNSGGR